MIGGGKAGGAAAYDEDVDLEDVAFGHRLRLATKRHKIHKNLLLNSCSLWLTFVLFEQECGVRTTKTERIRQCISNVELAGRVRHVVEIAVRIGYFVINSWRKNTALDHE